MSGGFEPLLYAGNNASVDLQSERRNVSPGLRLYPESEHSARDRLFLLCSGKFKQLCAKIFQKPKNFVNFFNFFSDQPSVENSSDVQFQLQRWRKLGSLHGCQAGTIPYLEPHIPGLTRVRQCFFEADLRCPEGFSCEWSRENQQFQCCSGKKRGFVASNDDKINETTEGISVEETQIITPINTLQNVTCPSGYVSWGGKCLQSKKKKFSESSLNARFWNSGIEIQGLHP